MLSVNHEEALRFRGTRARLTGLSPGQAAPLLRAMAQQVRRDDLRMIHRSAALGHIGGDFSVIDILVTLYAAVLSVDPAEPLAAQRDRLVLSQGHTAGALYATLAYCGFFARRELETFAAHACPRSTATRTGPRCPEVETNTGALGHGFPSPSASRCPPGCRPRPAARSSSSATGNCRRAATGRPP